MSQMQTALAYWAEKASCAEIDLIGNSEFARVWVFSIMYGLALSLAITIPYRWCRSGEVRVAILNGDSANGGQEGSSRQQLADTMNKDTTPDKEAAKRHLVRTSATRDHKWMNPLTCPASVLNEIGGTGTELYFRMLRNFGFMYAYMAALTAPIIAFAMLGNFGADTGQAIEKTTIGNLGQYTDASLLDPTERIVNLGCQGIELISLTYYFGWLDFASVLIFLSFVVYFRFVAIPRTAEQDSLEQVTPKDFAVAIDGLPYKIDNQVDYEKLLSEHLMSRIEYARSRLKEKDKPKHAAEVCELTLVRDYGGRLSDLKWRAELQQSKEIAEAHENAKLVEKLGAKLEKLNQKLEVKLGPDEGLPVIRAYAILNCTADVDLLLHDYRFGDYALFRCCQFRSRRFFGRKLRVRTCPEPTDLIWENQDVSFISRVLRKIVMYAIFFIIMAVSLAVIYSITVWSESQAESTLSYLGDPRCDPMTTITESGQPAFQCLVSNATSWSMDWAVSQGDDILNCWCSTQGYNMVFSDEDKLRACKPWLISLGTSFAISSGASCCVVVINMVLQIILIAMAHFERPLSMTALNSSMMQKVFAAQTMNTGFVLFFVNAWGGEVLQNLALVIPGLGELLFHGPFDDISRTWYNVVGVVLLTNMLLNSVVPASVSAAKLFATWFLRCCCGRGVKHQAELIQLYTNPEFDIKGKYAQFLTTVFVTMTYSAGLPLMNVFGCAFMFFMYWTDKFVLLWGSKRPPNYDTQMAKDATEYMLYAVPLHCVFAIFMYGQDCVFPSKPLGGTLGDLAALGTGYTPGFLGSVVPRVSKEATWMVFLLLVLVVALWVVWTVLWILGGTFGAFWDCLVTTCCPRRLQVMDEEDAAAVAKGLQRSKSGSINVAASMNWVAASEHIERSFPPASYRLDRHPTMETVGHLLRRPVTSKGNLPRSPNHPPPAAVGKPDSNFTSFNAPVKDPIAKSFLEALNAEYVLGTGAAVGNFFQATPGVEDKLIKFEDQVRDAADKNAEIEKIATRWGVAWP